MALDFTWQELTVAINNVPYLPGQVGRLGLFTPKPQSTTMAFVEQKAGRLALVPEQPRGSPPTSDVQDRASLVSIRVPHFPIRDSLYADAVQDQRGFGTMELARFPTALQTKIDSLGQRLDVTLEHLRLGAVKGIITTAVDRVTGAPLRTINLFDYFEVAAQQPRQWPIIGAGVAQEQAAWNSQLTALVNELGRAMANEVPAGMLQGFYGFAGAEFFDAFSMHPERRAAYIGFPSPATVGPVRGNAVMFRDLVIEEYRGAVVGVPFVGPRDCYFVPLGIPDLFAEVFAPADYTDTVNTLGLARYLKQEQMEFDKGTSLEAQMNVLPLCTIPRALFRATATDYVPIPFGEHAAGNNRQAARAR